MRRWIHLPSTPIGITRLCKIECVKAETTEYVTAADTGGCVTPGPLGTRPTLTHLLNYVNLTAVDPTCGHQHKELEGPKTRRHGQEASRPPPSPCQLAFYSPMEPDDALVPLQEYYGVTPPRARVWSSFRGCISAVIIPQTVRCSRATPDSEKRHLSNGVLREPVVLPREILFLTRPVTSSE